MQAIQLAPIHSAGTPSLRPAESIGGFCATCEEPFEGRLKHQGCLCPRWMILAT